jgi:hypothetical protein
MHSKAKQSVLSRIIGRASRYELQVKREVDVGNSITDVGVMLNAGLLRVQQLSLSGQIHESCPLSMR